MLAQDWSGVYGVSRLGQGVEGKENQCEEDAAAALDRLKQGARQAREAGLEVHAGHGLDYDTARVIDEEVERILREQEQRCRDTLNEHRAGLDLVARALLELVPATR